MLISTQCNMEQGKAKTLYFKPQAGNLRLLLEMFLILKVKFLGELSTIGLKFKPFIGNVSNTKSEISRRIQYNRFEM